MHGNIFEWCEDWHGEYPFAVTDPKGLEIGKSHVLRGGSFGDSFSNVSSSVRSSSRFYNCYGFRLVRTP
jgi:formylglycine-generating enzyme required for sulfatase activity